MDNQDQAAHIIMKCVQDGYSPTRIAERLADYGLITPDPPEPCIYPDTGEHEWHTVDGYVSVEDGIIHVIHDETNDDNEPDELMPDWAELRISDTTKAREAAYAILAACEYRDAHDD